MSKQPKKPAPKPIEWWGVHDMSGVLLMVLESQLLAVGFAGLISGKVAYPVRIVPVAAKRRKGGK